VQVSDAGSRATTGAVRVGPRVRVGARVRGVPGATTDAAVGLVWRPTPEAGTGLYTGPLDVVGVPGGGAVVVFVRPGDDRRAEILAQRLDADGEASEAPRRLRLAEGPITALDADLHGDRLWVAWVANPGGDPNQENVRGTQRIAALAVSTDLSRVTQPVRLLDYVLGAQAPSWPYPVVEVRGRGDGGAVVVGLAPAQRCADAACPGWAAHTLAVDGVFRTETLGLAAGQVPPFALVRTGTGAALLVGDDGGTVHVRGVAGMTGIDTAVSHAASPRLAVQGGQTYFFAADAADAGPAARLRVRRLGPGTGASEAVVTGHALRCVGALPVVEYTWAGGGVTLNPDNATASFDLARHLPEGALGERMPAVAWTGRVVVGADPAHGTLERWRCVGAALRALDPHGHGA